MNNAYVEVTAGGEVAFGSPDSPGAGIFRVRPGACSGPSFVVVDYSVESGDIYAALFTANFAHQIGTANPTAAEEGKIYLYLEQSIPEDAVLLIGSRESGTKGRVRKISVIAVRQMSRSEYKHYRSWSFPHWYYSCELGDGIARRATIANEKTIMPALIGTRSRSIHMMERHVGDLSGVSILDVGCSAGFQTMEFARRGAIVTGIDWDQSAIEQAVFVHDCVAEQLRHPVTFKCSSLFDYDAPEGEFDYVHCSGLLYHLRDPIGAAERLRRWARKGVVVACCVAPREGDLLVLSDPNAFPFCASWEFALVPTATMVRKILDYAGLDVQTFADWTEFEGDPADPTTFRYVPPSSLYASNNPYHGPVYAFARPKRPPMSR